MKKSSFILLLLVIIIPNLKAQENDTIKESKINISGYIQMDYQHFFVPDSIGATTPYFASFSGGNFVNDVTKDRFTIRRGRLKISNQGENHKGMFSIDISEKGVGIRDLYLKYTDPFINSFSIYGGMFNRAFGQEIELSSAERESPERSRVIQTIFPHDRDLGFMLKFQMPEDKALHFVNLKFGIVNGNGTAIETDNYKDFIGRLGVNFALIDIKNPIEILKNAVIEILFWIKIVIYSLGLLVTGGISGNDIAGPVGIVGEISSGYQESIQYGIKSVIATIAFYIVLLSANLGVMNLLPIPALDGGRIVFIAIEALRGKPIDPNKEGFIHFVGYVLLMILMVLILFNDIVKAAFS